MIPQSINKKDISLSTEEKADLLQDLDNLQNLITAYKTME